MMRRRRIHGPWKSAERLLVGIAPSPYAESLIRWTRKQASSLDCPWIGLYVETTQVLTDAEQVRLGRALGLVRKLGGEIVTVTDDDVAGAVLKAARERNVSQIVLGKTEPLNRPAWLRTPTLTDHIARESGDIDVCLVRPTQARTFDSTGSISAGAPKHPLHEYAWALGGVLVHTALGWLLLNAIGYTAVGMLYLMGVIAGAMLLSRGPVLLLAAASALMWNYLFIPPRFTFAIKEPHDIMMFAAFFIVALSMGHLTSRLRQRERAERERQQHTAAILGVTQSAALHAEFETGIAAALRIIDSVVGGTTALIQRLDDHTLSDSAHAASSFFPQGKEWGVISWCFNRKQAAGRGTDTLPQSEGLYLPLQTATSIMGVLGLRFPEKRIIEPATLRIIEAFALQLALVLEKQHFIEAVKEAEVRDRKCATNQTGCAVPCWTVCRMNSRHPSRLCRRPLTGWITRRAPRRNLTRWNCALPCNGCIEW
jgi:two-component system, OmpR family, sensor histidine kinase KdpD